MGVKCNLTFQIVHGVSHHVLSKIESRFTSIKVSVYIEITPEALIVDYRSSAAQDTAYISDILETVVTDAYSRLFIRHLWNCLPNTSDCDRVNVAVTRMVRAGYRLRWLPLQVFSSYKIRNVSIQ